MDERLHEVDRRLVKQLGELAPEAVPAFEAANRARDAEDHVKAEKLYAKVVEQAPGFTPAQRRLCGTKQHVGKRSEALRLCRQAAEDGDAANVAALAAALARSAEDEPSRPAELAEALRLARQAVEADPDDVWSAVTLCNVGLARQEDLVVQGCLDTLERVAPKDLAASVNAARAQMLLSSTQEPSPALHREVRAALDRAERFQASNPDVQLGRCQLALSEDNLPALRRCSNKLVELSPDNPVGHAFMAMAAASDGDFDEAEKALAMAKEKGLPPSTYESLAAGITESRPFYDGVGGLVAWVLGVWLGGIVLLVLAGLALSGAALRASTSVAAPGSGRAHGMAAWVRRLYVAVLWLCCSYYYASVPLVLASVVLVGGGVVVAVIMAGYIPIKLLVIVGLVGFGSLAAVLKSLFVRVSDEDPGMRLDLTEHPRLRAVLDEVAAKVGTHSVDTVFLTPGTELAVFEQGKMATQLRGRAERCLILGAGVIEDMSQSDFKAVLAHEYGHFSNEDTAGGGFALAVRRSLVTMTIGLAENGAAAWYNPAWLFVRGFYKVFLRISHGASRLQEVLADRWAAYAYGSAAFERGLTHVIAQSVRFDAHVNATLQEVVDEKRPLANLYDYVPTKPVDESEVEAEISEAMNREPSAYDSHPAPRDRIAWVRSLGVPDTADGADADVWSLFEDRGKLEDLLTSEVCANVCDNTGIVIQRAGA